MKNKRVRKQVLVSEAIWQRLILATHRFDNGEGVQRLTGNILRDWVVKNAHDVALPVIDINE